MYVSITVLAIHGSSVFAMKGRERLRLSDKVARKMLLYQYPLAGQKCSPSVLSQELRRGSLAATARALRKKQAEQNEDGPSNEGKAHGFVEKEDAQHHAEDRRHEEKDAEARGEIAAKKPVPDEVACETHDEGLKEKARPAERRALEVTLAREQGDRRENHRARGELPEEHLRGGRPVHGGRAKEDRRKAPGNPGAQAERVTENPEVLFGRRFREGGEQKGDENPAEGEKKPGPLNEVEALFGKLHGEPHGGKERGRVEKHRHVGGRGEAKALGNEEEFPREAKPHEERVAKLHVGAPDLFQPIAVEEPQKKPRDGGPQAHLQHGTHGVARRLDGDLLQAPHKAKAHAHGEGEEVDGTANGLVGHGRKKEEKDSE